MNQQHGYGPPPSGQTNRASSYHHDRYSSPAIEQLAQCPAHSDSRSPAPIGYIHTDRPCSNTPLCTSRHFQAALSYPPKQQQQQPNAEAPMLVKGPLLDHASQHKTIANERRVTELIRPTLPVICGNDAPEFGSLRTLSNIHPPQQYRPYLRQYPNVDNVAHCSSGPLSVQHSPDARIPLLSSATTPDYSSNDRRWNGTVTRNDNGMIAPGAPSAHSFAATEHELEPYGCAVGECRATFSGSSALFYHVKNWHSSNLEDVEKPFRCAIMNCIKRYKNINGLQYHLREAKGTSGHPTLPGKPPPQQPEKTLRCPTTGCKKTYRTINGLKYHQTHAHRQS